jgi:twitching motility two-component system response regulator PilH
MLLKLRQKRQPQSFPADPKPEHFSINFNLVNDLREHALCANSSANVAFDVHLCSVDYCLGLQSGEPAVLKKVLIVDDSPAQVKLMQGLLEPEGYQPIGVNDPRRVEEAITNERPSLILLDVVMPERNGFQVCRELKSSSEFNMIPVILVTSKDSASDKYWGEQQGADGYVTKPFTREELLRAVRRFA